MKDFINKQIEKIKGFLSKGISFNPSIVGITVIISIVALCASYNIGSTHKLNRLVEQEAQTAVAELQQSDSELTSEIEKLSAQKDDLNTDLSGKTDIQNALQAYNTNKTDYTNQISQLDKSIESLDTSIQQKQTQLDTKKAAKAAEEERIAAEKAAAEKAAQEAEKKKSSSQNTTVNNNQSYTVYITNTGAKYHSSGCQYLKKSKIAISKDSAVAQGYTPCSRCNP